MDVKSCFKKIVLSRSCLTNSDEINANSFQFKLFQMFFLNILIRIALLRENGLIQQAAQSTMLSHSKSLKGRLNANEQMNDGHAYLKFEDLTGVFYIVLFGFVSSILAFLSEIVWHKLCIYSRNSVIVV